jgi:predicted RND superfamily exporter protein
MPSIIGILMLMGIVTKNSILLVEYASVARREHGMSRYDALMDACHKRAQPIVMTTIAMAAGMFPIALGWSAEPSFRSPMAIAVIGGVITSTALSLLVIPVVFTYVDDLLDVLKVLVKRFMPINEGQHDTAVDMAPVAVMPALAVATTSDEANSLLDVVTDGVKKNSGKGKAKSRSPKLKQVN